MGYAVSSKLKKKGDIQMSLIIDPGHGGKDKGGGSNQYWLEKDMVLKISLYQYERFKELGVDVCLTRDSDMYLSPNQRTSIVKESGAIHCISNHINAGGGDGVETIHSIYSEGELANAVANEIVKEGQNLRRVFTRTLPYRDRSDYYFMHRETGEVSTVIVEYGFADSKKDDVEQLLHHWKEYAEAVVKAYCRFINHPYDKHLGFPNDTPQWKQEAVNWMYRKGLLTNEEWKGKINEPLPLWAEGLVLKRLIH